MTHDVTRLGQGVLLTLLILAGQSLSWGAAGRGGGQFPNFQEDLAAAYSRLTAMKKWDAEADSKLKLEMANLTDRYILARLNAQPSPDASSLEADLNEAFSQAIGHMSAPELEKFWGEAHYASVLIERPLVNTYIIGYVIPHGNTSLDVIEIAQLIAGSYRFSARGGAEMQDYTLRLREVSPREGKVRFVAYGQRLEANESPLSVVLYQFDGRSLSPLWSRSQLWQGTVQIADGSVTLTFQDPARFQKSTPPYFRREEYVETDTGLRLLSQGWADAP